MIFVLNWISINQLNKYYKSSALPNWAFQPFVGGIPYVTIISLGESPATQITQPAEKKSLSENFEKKIWNSLQKEESKKKKTWFVGLNLENRIWKSNGMQIWAHFPKYAHAKIHECMLTWNLTKHYYSSLLNSVNADQQL